MRVILTDPSFSNKGLGRYLRHSLLEPIAIEYLGAVARELGCDVRIAVLSRPSAVRAYVEGDDPIVLGLSAVTSYVASAIDIAAEAKATGRNVLTVLGGYHASACPEVVENQYIDFVVVGEGERTFADLLEAIGSGRSPHDVCGLAYWDGGLRMTPGRERIDNLDTLPFPLRSHEILSMCKIGGFVYPPPSEQRGVSQVTYSRGCPYACRFCSCPRLWGNLVRSRDPRSVVAEIRYLEDAFGTNMVFFTDLTFNLDKARVYDLCQEMVRQKTSVHWFAMCRIDKVEGDLLAVMKNAGCTKISFGVDAVHEVNLSEMKPSQNVTLSGIRSALELAGEAGIIVRGYVIIGYPNENKQSLVDTSNILRSLPIDDLRISFLTPFPGTVLYNEYRERGLLLTEDPRMFTADTPVVRTRDLPPEDLVEMRRQIFSDFYGSSEYYARVRRKLRRQPHLKESYVEFRRFLDSVGVVEENPRRTRTTVRPPDQ